jgi:hypothetical protein
MFHYIEAIREPLQCGVGRCYVQRDGVTRGELIGADLRDANLSRADLRDADLSRANLIGADLRGANLSSADLSSANLIGADLRGAELILTAETTSDVDEHPFFDGVFYRTPEGRLFTYDTFGSSIYIAEVEPQ